MVFVVSPEQKVWRSNGSSAAAGQLLDVGVDPLLLLVLKSFY